MYTCCIEEHFSVLKTKNTFIKERNLTNATVTTSYSEITDNYMIITCTCNIIQCKEKLILLYALL